MRRAIWLLMVLALVFTGYTKQAPAVEHKAGDRLVKTVDGVEYAFRWCPSGKFTMGSPKSEWDAAKITRKDYDETQHEVTLTQGFWMLETEVTQAMWQSVMGSNPSSFKGDNLPVDHVSWDDCQDFCQKLSSKIGMKITLPTEAQWEYACRAGSTGPYAGELDAMGWYGRNSDGNPYPAGQKKANAWGLYDMHGNVWEWCQDWYGEYPSGTVTDPTGPDSGSEHICRGGSWLDLKSASAQNCRSANRDSSMPDFQGANLGFRVVGSSNPSAGENASDSNKQMEQPQPEPQLQASSNAEKLKAGDRLVKTVDGVEYAFRWCPPGKFMMGSPKSEWDSAEITGEDYDETQHEVTLTQGFWMLETEVTQGMWQSVMGTSLETQAQKMLDDDRDLGVVPYTKVTLRDIHAVYSDREPSTLTAKDVVFGKGSNYPMYFVSWGDCQEFCQKLSSKIGMKISLPTEAQWEYACRAGTTTPFSFGSTLNGDKANCDGNYPYGTETKGKYLKKTVPVKSYIPNAWGLYDMHGNVWEWCQDWYDEYPSGAVTDPTGPNGGSNRVIRGGGWNSLARLCRSAYRNWSSADNWFNHRGFRVVGSVQ